MDLTKRRATTFVATFLILALIGCPGDLRAGRRPQSDEKIKAKVVNSGVGEKVSVKLRAGRDIKGKLSEVRDADFVVIDKETAQARTIAYSMVKDIHSGYGMRRGFKIAMWVGIVYGIAGAIVLAVCGSSGCTG